MSDNFSQNLKELIRLADNNKTRVAKALRVKPPYISMLSRGKKTPSEALTQLVKVTLDDVRAGRSVLPPAKESPKSNARFADLAAYGFRQIPVISWTRAGEARSYEDLAHQIDSMTVSDTKDENAFALIVEGDSMREEYQPGDLIVCSPNSEPRTGKDVVVRLKSGESMLEGGVLLKRFYRFGQDGRGVRLESLNPEYPTKEYKLDDFWFIYPVVTQIKNRR